MMMEQPAYSWDFDRPTDEYLNSFDSFSVAIFQWLPKANGHDLKKSKAVARVVGYPAEAERVYRMALRICSRLNREDARFGSTPNWLQKQYSIPRPADMFVVRDASKQTTARLRNYRVQVMKKLLLPAGFVAGKEGTYQRRSGNQIHLITFETRQSVPHVRLTLGFHYNFVPARGPQQIPLKDLKFLDCIVNTNANRLLVPANKDWFRSDLREEMIRDLEESATDTLKVLEKYALRWRSAADFLADRSGQKEWTTHSELDPVALACVAIRCGQLELAETLVGKVSEPERSYRWNRPTIDWLLELVSKYRPMIAAGLELPAMPDWYDG